MLLADCPTAPPTNCTCHMDYVAPDPDGVTLRPVTTINCSYRGLSDLPEKLPVVTTTLLLKGNQVLFLCLTVNMCGLCNGTVSQSSHIVAVVDELVSVQHWQKTIILRENPVSFPHCPPQIPHGLM